MSSKVTHRFGASSAVNRADWVMAVLRLKERYCKGPFAIKVLHDWRSRELVSSEDPHIPLRVKGSAIDVAIEEQVHKPHKEGKTRFRYPERTNCMTAISDAGPFLLGNDTGIYAASYSSLVFLATTVTRSEVRKIEFIHELGSIFVLTQQQLRAYEVLDSESEKRVGIDVPISLDPTRLLLRPILGISS
jgi:hypothetical protein